MLTVDNKHMFATDTPRQNCHGRHPGPHEGLYCVVAHNDTGIIVGFEGLHIFSDGFPQKYGENNQNQVLLAWVPTHVCDW